MVVVGIEDRQHGIVCVFGDKYGRDEDRVTSHH